MNPNLVPLGERLEEPSFPETVEYEGCIFTNTKTSIQVDTGMWQFLDRFEDEGGSQRDQAGYCEEIVIESGVCYSRPKRLGAREGVDRGGGRANHRDKSEGRRISEDRSKLGRSGPHYSEYHGGRNDERDRYCRGRWFGRSRERSRESRENRERHGWRDEKDRDRRRRIPSPERSKRR